MWINSRWGEILDEKKLWMWRNFKLNTKNLYFTLDNMLSVEQMWKISYMATSFLYLLQCAFPSQLKAQNFWWIDLKSYIHISKFDFYKEDWFSTAWRAHVPKTTMTKGRVANFYAWSKSPLCPGDNSFILTTEGKSVQFCFIPIIIIVVLQRGNKYSARFETLKALFFAERRSERQNGRCQSNTKPRRHSH